MRIGGFDTGERVLVVAEIGNNHEGEVEVARQLVEAAAEAGAGAVKLQTFDPARFVGPSDPERLARLERFRLRPEELSRVAALAHERGLFFLSTPLDLGSVDLLEPLVDAYKIASGDNTFEPLLRRVAASGKPVVVSGGLAEPDELERAVELVRTTPGFGGELAVLHCVSAYPTPPEEASLGAIGELRRRLDATIGYSDHTLGIEASVLSVAAGARIVEKHFTLAHDFSEFRDHRLSAEPAELAELVRRVREAEVLLGDGKAVQPSEQEGRVAYRRSIVAALDLPAGRCLEPTDITWVRPGGGLPPGSEAVVVGKVLRHDVSAGQLLTAADVV